ncbi:hypothetical protein KUCAC02_018745 [Chaenocephalus aceratus]|uniref:Uncharacterized protein n=1 Tax=Chaenocephalus aceratus TaxID=36190 RepID=A0ACB9WA49_CHAAC|nr:hypothetical protein KUCAC02_018745 [Chaenocephalus aceratus]
MFAYVKYLDDGKTNDSNNELFIISHNVHVIRIADVKYLHSVLFLPDTKEDIEQQLSEGKRVRMRKLKETTPPRASSEKEEAKSSNVYFQCKLLL